MKKKVLILAGYYEPSVKGGGPIQSLKNLVDNLSNKLDFYIVAMDRDLGDDKPFPNVETNKWISGGKAKIFYIDPVKLTWKKISDIINSVDYDVMYLNSFFSYKFSIVPLLLKKIKKIPQKPVILAPRGQFSPGALGLKSWKKKLYIKITKALGLYKNIIWHATAENEREDIEAVFGKDANIRIASNLTANYMTLRYEKNIKKEKGELKIVFISRIHPNKNLKKALELLKCIDGKIDFNIYGPIEDKTYWEDCKKMIEDLPQNIKVSYKGIVAHDKVIDIFKQHHIFLFPTLGENFGHVISEALIGGCPVIISNQTPWKNLEQKQVGWDISLCDENRFINAIQYCVNLSNEQYNILSKNAFEYGKKLSNSIDDINQAFRLVDI